jgi:hypothetical protein
MIGIRCNFRDRKAHALRPNQVRSYARRLIAAVGLPKTCQYKRFLCVARGAVLR